MSPINFLYCCVTKEGCQQYNNISVNSTRLQSLQIRRFCGQWQHWTEKHNRKIKINSQMFRHKRGVKAQNIFFTKKYFIKNQLLHCLWWVNCKLSDRPFLLEPRLQPYTYRTYDHARSTSLKILKECEINIIQNISTKSEGKLRNVPKISCFPPQQITCMFQRDTITQLQGCS